MRKTASKLLAKLPLVWSAAAAMGWLGLYLMYWGTPFVPTIGEFWTTYVVIASIIVWSVGGLLLLNRSRAAWLWFGLLSPLLGAMLVAPPASFAFVIVKGYVAFPVGLATGFLMYYLCQIEFPIRLDAPRQEFNEISDQSSDPQPEVPSRPAYPA